MTTRSMKYVDVLDSKMAYVDEGAGGAGKPVVLFLHGNPTSSYLWRNVIPHVAPLARCIAPDLIGFGHSDKPDIAYRIPDHARYVQGFMEALGLDDLVLVLHDWGSALGLDWARRNSSRVRGLALMEFIPPIPTWLDLRPQPRAMFTSFRGEGGRKLIIEGNAFVERTLPGGVIRKLSHEEMEEYRRPFLTPESREPVYRFPNELPIAGTPADIYAMVTAYNDWLLKTETPKLFFYADPGVFIPPERAAFYSAHLKSCRTVALGEGSHFVQEDHFDKIGQEISAWLPTLASGAV